MQRLFVITGPSGVGKGTLIAGLCERHPELSLAVSATTRAPRPRERDGVDYYFLTDAEFDARLRAGEFVEHASYAGHRYGTLRSELGRERPPHAAVVLEIEVQGARQIRDSIPGATLIFIAPPTLEDLRERLRARGTDADAVIEERMAVASTELGARGEFPHAVVNASIEQALAELETIYRNVQAEGPSDVRLYSTS